MRKPVFGVSNRIRHIPSYTATEDGQRLKISDLESRGIVLLCSDNTGADLLRGYGKLQCSGHQIYFRNNIQMLLELNVGYLQFPYRALGNT